MAAPMHHMAAAGQFMPQQQNRFGVGNGNGNGNMELSTFIYQTIANNPVPMPPGSWQHNVPIGERVRIVQEL